MFAHSAICLGLLVLAIQDTTPPSGPPTGPDQPTPKSLAAENTELIPALIAALAEEDRQITDAASAALVALGREAVPALIKAIEGENNGIRASAAMTVGRMASAEYVPAEAVPVLIKALKDKDRAVKQAAAYAIKALVIHSKGGQWRRGSGRRGRRGSGGVSANRD